MAKKSVTTRGEELAAFARGLKNAGCNWVQGNNALYGPGGKYLELFPTQQERDAFNGSAADKKIRAILEELPDPPFNADVREASGKLLVRMPKSIHQALIAEAEEEDVSLNQLIVAKLALRLRMVTAMRATA